MTKARTLADNYAADINQITASAPLTGGGTSGTVTVGIQDGTTSQKGAVQLEDSTASTSTTKASTPNSVKSAYDLANGAIAKSTIDAKGDLLVGTANDTVSRLAVASTAGYLLSVDSAEATGLKWAAPAGGGKVLQVVQATYATETSITTDSTYSDTGGTITITPTSATSKVLLICSLSAGLTRSNNTGQGGTFRFMRGATEIFKYQVSANSALFTRMGTGDGSQTIVFGLYALNYLDEPATTSATTYKIQGKVLYTSNSGAIICQSEATNSVMLALEIGA